MASSGIDLTIAEHVAILTLEREHCLDIAGKRAIASQIRQLGEELGPVRALILCATDPSAWLVNVAELADMPQSEARAFSREGHALADAIANLPVPVIAAVDGPALGGGCELALACDLAFAGEQAKFGQIEAQGGVMPGFGGTWRLEERAGYQRALLMMLTGEVVDARTAKQYGLVLDVFASSMLLESVKELAHRIAATSRQSVAAIKRVTRAGRGAPAALRDRLEEEAFPALFETAEQRGRMRAFLAQAKPHEDPKSPAAAQISARTSGIVFIQIWSFESKESQRKMLEIMHERIGLLTRQPGFVSMSLHPSLDGKTMAVYAQWNDEGRLRSVERRGIAPGRRVSSRGEAKPR